MACDAPANINEWTQCNTEAVVAPVIATVETVVGVGVTLTILVVGVRFTKRVVRMFGG